MRTIPRTTCPRGSDPVAWARPPASGPPPPTTRSWAPPSRERREPPAGWGPELAWERPPAARARAPAQELGPGSEPVLEPAGPRARDRRTARPHPASDSRCLDAAPPAAEPTPAR